jgi:hypothetical protein
LNFRESVRCRVFVKQIMKDLHIISYSLPPNDM